MPRVSKKTLTEWWLKGAWIGADGQLCAAEAPGSRYVEARRVPAGTPGAEKVTFKSTKYYGRVPGKRDPVPLCAQKAASETMLAEMNGKSVLKSLGLDDFEEHRRRLLSEHLKDYKGALEAKGSDPRHVAETVRLVSAFLAGAKAEYAADLDLSAAQEWLSSLRAERADIPAHPGEPDRDADEARGFPAGYSVPHVARLLGVKPDSVSPLIKRRHLPSHGRASAYRTI